MVWTSVAMAAVSAATTIYSSEQARTSANKARDAQKEQAKKTLMQQDEAENRANQKQANTQSLIEQAVSGNKGGVASTLLTGPSGVDSTKLTLGKSSLLGG